MGVECSIGVQGFRLRALFTPVALRFQVARLGQGSRFRGSAGFRMTTAVN